MPRFSVLKHLRGGTAGAPKQIEVTSTPPPALEPAAAAPELLPEVVSGARTAPAQLPANTKVAAAPTVDAVASTAAEPKISAPDPLVDEAIRFLQHPSTQNTPVDDRVAFLTRKGLDAKQVAEALEAPQPGASALPAALAAQAAAEEEEAAAAAKAEADATETLAEAAHLLDAFDPAFTVIIERADPSVSLGMNVEYMDHGLPQIYAIDAAGLVAATGRVSVGDIISIANGMDTSLGPDALVGALTSTSGGVTLHIRKPTANPHRPAETTLPSLAAAAATPPPDPVAAAQIWGGDEAAHAKLPAVESPIKDAAPAARAVDISPPPDQAEALAPATYNTELSASIVDVVDGVVAAAAADFGIGDDFDPNLEAPPAPPAPPVAKDGGTDEGEPKGEWVNGWSSILGWFSRAVSHSDLEDIFRAFDTDRSGFIDMDELQGALSKAGKAASREDCEKILEQVDTNADGQISFDEVCMHCGPKGGQCRCWRSVDALAL